jgi:hypothetical protein
MKAIIEDESKPNPPTENKAFSVITHIQMRAFTPLR